MRKIATVFLGAFLLSFTYAGDLANFVSLGFSSDGSKFVFGQHGVTDVDFQAYADIWCVDVAKNIFIKDGLFSIPPSKGTASKDSRGVFSALQNTAAGFLKTNKIDSSLLGRSLYVYSENEPGLTDFSFRDFETGSLYSVQLRSIQEGAAATVSSSFYLIVDIKKSDGTTIRKTVGHPAFKRAGVKAYLVRKIVIDQSGTSVVFVVEKYQYNKTGDSVRYMVETMKL